MDKNNSEKLMIEINTLLEKDTDINLNYKKALRGLRKKLPLGWAKTISEKTRKTPIMVYKVMNGENKGKDDAIVLSAMVMAKEYTELLKERIKKINSL